MMGACKRVLHVVRAMNRGGVETWLMNVLRRLDRRRLQIDFLVHTPDPGVFDSEILDCGSRILRCPWPLWSPQYALGFGRLLRRFGPFDAVHSHVHFFSGYLMALGHLLGVPLRIAHSHTAAEPLSRYTWRRGYVRSMRSSLRAHATRLVAVSRGAARSLYGDHWASDPRALVLHCGIDLAPFADQTGRTLRPSLNIADQDFVVGHVGRFDAPKNHAFLLKIAAAVLERRPRARLMLVGDGPLRKSVEQQARDMGIADRVIVTGERNDVPRLLRVMDVMIFPSIAEGLPLTLLEAQAAGLPCVISDVITEEADVIAGLLHRVPLSESAERWAEIALDTRFRPRPAPADAWNRMAASSFNIANSLEGLYALYGA